MAASRATTSFLRPEEVFAQLQKGPVYPLYLFHGDELYLIDQAVARLRERMGKATAVRSFYAGETSLDALFDAWGTPSLFAPDSLIVLKSAELLKAAERERLAQEAEFRGTTQPLVICAHGRVDLRQTFFSLCAKKGFVAEFRSPFPNQIVEWAQRFARERKVRLSEEAALLLAELLGPDLLALSAEIDKLIAFIFPNTDISAEAVSQCAGDVYKHSVFDLTDALGQRDRQKALGLLQRVLVDERAALQVLHALVGHFRRLWLVKELASAGKPEEEIAQIVGLRGQRLRLLLGQSRLYTVADLQQLWHRVTALDMTLKSSRTAPLALLQALILEACTRPSSARST
ncbi:MAG TPA: DNA polymerase III subunit delta [Candidatus Binatia bacterium]|jgi:DNA polymerase-3 subunit delta|nr:DNA polymerase III subunit delta [Candidatus Binatia bacterium]